MQVFNKITALLLALSLSLVWTGCDESDNPEAPGSPYINIIEPEMTFVGDIISVYGSNLGVGGDSSYIEFSSGLRVYSSDCMKWHNSIIMSKVPYGASSGTFTICAEGEKSNILDLEIENTPPLDLVLIKAGTFMMGSDIGWDNEKPIHEVAISSDFYMAKYEVRQKLWIAVMGDRDFEYSGADLPAHGISWLEAIKFCNKLSELKDFDLYYVIEGDEALINYGAGGFRLPTEAEWEYACRAGSVDEFSGDGELNNMGWYSLNSGSKPHPVGQKTANAFGLFDMHGNVWEWCFDNFWADYYQYSEKVDPIGPSSGDRKVLRGGSWNSGASYARSANRMLSNDYQSSSGFRIVRAK